MTWQDAATVGGLISSICMPIIVILLNASRKARDTRFDKIEQQQAHFDKCLDERMEKLSRDIIRSFEGITSQINGLHLEVAREYVTRAEHRVVVEDLRAEIGLGRGINRIEDALRQRS